jgi:hypothetical protein
VAWQTLTATANARTVTATATATPAKVVWDMGDGDSVTCDGPGTPYSASDSNATTDCSYTWPQAGNYTVTATVYWSVTWTAVGTAGGGDLGLQAGVGSENSIRRLTRAFVCSIGAATVRPQLSQLVTHCVILWYNQP